MRSLLAAAWLVLAPATGIASDAAPLVFDSAEFFALDQPDPPDPSARGERVALPDFWRQRRRTWNGFGWYRVDLPADLERAREYGVYVADLDISAAVYLDGIRIGACGDPERPRTTQCSNSPLFVVFPGRWLRAEGPSRLDIRVYGEPYAWNRLSRVEFGPAEVLAPRYASQRFVQVRLAEFGTMLGLVLSMIMGVLWIGRRRDPVYGWFLASSLSWSVSSLAYWVQAHPMGFWGWQRIVFGALDWFAIFGAITVQRMLGVRRPVLDRTLLAAAAAVPAVLWSVPERSFQLASGVMHAVALALVVFSLASCVRDLRRLPRAEIATLALCLILCLAFGLHDYLVHFALVGVSRPLMLQFAGPVILLSFGVLLTTRFVREYRRAENLNAELEQRVHEKHRELEANFERMRELERAHVLALERGRLMREVHDGIGGQLVSTLAMVEGGPVAGSDVAEALRAALDEMRLVVQSLDPLVDDLPTLLGVVRARLEPRLATQGLRFEWAVRDLPPMPELGRDGFLHVLRIVQEAITNVVKHAKARVITVSTGLREDASRRRGVFLEVRDDGVGAAAASSAGRGIANMRQRADEIGARLTIRDADPGTCVELWLPLTPGA